jgi:hypothetical protein
LQIVNCKLQIESQQFTICNLQFSGAVMVRIPATLVALVLALSLSVGTFALAQVAMLAELPIALLPLWASLGGLIAGRWGKRTPPVPGFAVGLLLVACQIGAARGAYPPIQAFVKPALLLIQIIAAISGGMTGTLLARRFRQAEAPEPEYTSLA